jgi:hypothetical protein
MPQSSFEPDHSESRQFALPMKFSHTITDIKISIKNLRAVFFEEKISQSKLISHKWPLLKMTQNRGDFKASENRLFETRFGG